MNKFYKILSGVILFSLLSLNAAYAEINQSDYKEVIKLTKKLRKLADKNEIEELAKYYSEDYKSFDGYNKKQMLEIFSIANKLYPNSKTKETILKTEAKDDLIKIYLTEHSKARIDVKGEDAAYATKNKVKGEVVSNSDYSMIYRKEENGWMVLGDEIYSETTEIRYGEAIKADFDIEVPENITPGDEFTVKAVVKIPENRFVVGSIGHDKIVFPPEKYYDPYRAINKTGILERVMIANKEGLNEYANMTVAFITPFGTGIDKETRLEKIKAAISGMGIYVKRINTKENSIEKAL